MSKEALAGFMSKLAEDAGLQEELRAAAEGTGDEAAVPTERFVEIAGGLGYEFTADEALGIFEVADEELDSVSGGAAFAKYDGVVGRFNKASVGMLKDEVGKLMPLNLLFGHKNFKFF